MLNPADYISVKLPTRDDVIRAVHMAYDPLSGSERIGQRCLLLDYKLDPVNLPDPPNPAIPNDVSEYIQGLTITNNTAEDVHRSCDLKITQVPGITLNTLLHRIRIYIVFYDEHGDELFAVPKGTFRFVWPDREITDAQAMWSIKGSDLTSQIADKDFLNPYVIPQGYNVIAAMENILAADYRWPAVGGRAPSGGSWPWGNDAGLTPAGCLHAGPNVPRSMMALTPSALTTPATRLFTWKDNQLAALKSLATSICYYPVWADSLGQRLSAPSPFQYVDGQGVVLLPPAAWTYTTDDSDPLYPPIFNGSITQRLGDPNKLANIVQIIVNNNSNAPLRIVQVNQSANSQISLDNWHDSKILTIQDDHVPNVSTAYLRAFLELQLAAATNSTIEFTTSINPFHETHDYLSLNVTTRDGSTRIVSTPNNLFEEVSWQINLDNFEMRHTAVEVIPI